MNLGRRAINSMTRLSLRERSAIIEERWTSLKSQRAENQLNMPRFSAALAAFIDGLSNLKSRSNVLQKSCRSTKAFPKSNRLKRLIPSSISVLRKED
jgi:hypothetical protein